MKMHFGNTVKKFYNTERKEFSVFCLTHTYQSVIHHMTVFTFYVILYHITGVMCQTEYRITPRSDLAFVKISRSDLGMAKTEQRMQPIKYVSFGCSTLWVRPRAVNTELSSHSSKLLVFRISESDSVITFCEGVGVLAAKL